MSRILLVEDDPTNAEIVTRFLHMKRYEVIPAADGPSGLALARSEKPDLILMDMALPHPGDGQKATLEIRSVSGLEGIPIVALTASAMPQQVQEMYHAGCNAIVTKPVDFNRLLQTIESLVNNRT